MSDFRGLIYEIVCLVDGKRYIGATTKSVSVRWKQHCGMVPRETADTCALMVAIRKYGPDAFLVQELACCSTRNDMFATEAMLIDQRKTLHPNGLNTMPGNIRYIKPNPDNKPFVDFKMVAKGHMSGWTHNTSDKIDIRKIGKQWSLTIACGNTRKLCYTFTAPKQYLCYREARRYFEVRTVSGEN